MSRFLMGALSVALATSVACGEGGEDGAVEILPDKAPIRMGQLYPLGENAPEPGTPERVPYEVVLLLKTESGALDIEKV